MSLPEKLEIKKCSCANNECRWKTLEIDGVYVGSIPPDFVDFFETMLRRYNCYDQLVEALEILLTWDSASTQDGWPMPKGTANYNKGIDKMKEALSAAKKGESK